MLFRCHETMEALEPAWRALHQGGVATPFEGYDWCAAWRQSCGAGWRLALVAAHDETGLAILFPFRVERRGGLRRLTWLAAGPSCHHAPLVRGDVHARLAPEDADRLLRQALAAVEPVDIAELPRQPMRIGRAENPFGERESVLSPLRTHALTIGADGPRVVEQAYAKRTRQRFAAFERKMQGRLAFHRVGPGPEAAAAMDQLIAWKRAQTAQRGEPSVMNDPAFRTFLTDFAARSQAPLEMAQLLIDGVPASAAVIQHRPSRQVVYQFAYDQENPFTHESPGRMLMRRMILDAAAAGAEELDFTIGDEPYKLSLCDRTERLRDQWIGLTPLGAAAAAFARARAEARIRLGPETRLGKALRRTLLRRAHAPGASFAA